MNVERSVEHIFCSGISNEKLIAEFKELADRSIRIINPDDNPANINYSRTKKCINKDGDNVLITLYVSYKVETIEESEMIEDFDKEFLEMNA